jgi:hypothetical protein
MPHYFTFIVSLFGTLVENEAGKIDEKLLLRLIPFIGIALRLMKSGMFSRLLLIYSDQNYHASNALELCWLVRWQ